MRKSFYKKTFYKKKFEEIVYLLVLSIWYSSILECFLSI